jgi:hypothetical protein
MSTSELSLEFVLIKTQDKGFPFPALLSGSPLAKFPLSQSSDQKYGVSLGILVLLLQLTLASGQSRKKTEK